MISVILSIYKGWGDGAVGIDDKELLGSPHHLTSGEEAGRVLR
jgi:hypothetical protein